MLCSCVCYNVSAFLFIVVVPAMHVRGPLRSRPMFREIALVVLAGRPHLRPMSASHVDSPCASQRLQVRVGGIYHGSHNFLRDLPLGPFGFPPQLGFPSCLPIAGFTLFCCFCLSLCLGLVLCSRGYTGARFSPSLLHACSRCVLHLLFCGFIPCALADCLYCISVPRPALRLLVHPLHLRL